VYLPAGLTADADLAERDTNGPVRYMTADLLGVGMASDSIFDCLELWIHIFSTYI
jgi:hypothetical protein